MRDKRIPFEELESARVTAASSMADARAPGLWLGAYAWPASTPAEAKAALEAVPRFEPLPATWDDITGEEFFVGNVYQLAGHTDEALPHLVRATHACDLLVNTFEHLHASFLLGQALESKHDIPGACKAYGVVLSHWGNAKPRSRTADAARARVKALSCP
jgi:serine/threonine-protein kinase